MFLLVLLLAAVFMMLNWFAPALVALRGVSADEAMKLSFGACCATGCRSCSTAWPSSSRASHCSCVRGRRIVFGAGAMMSGSVEGGMGAFVGLFFLLFIGAIFLRWYVGPIAIGSVYAGLQGHAGRRRRDGDEPRISLSALRPSSCRCRRPRPAVPIASTRPDINAGSSRFTRSTSPSGTSNTSSSCTCSTSLVRELLAVEPALHFDHRRA